MESSSRALLFLVKVVFMLNYDELSKKEYFKEIKELCDEYVSLYTISEKDKLLYHYTNLGGLEGIISGQRLWFTDYQHMKDPSEVRYFVDLIKQVVDNYKDETSNHNLSIFHSIFESTLKKHLICTISFCEQKNYLPAWRWYANNGAGFAIGFKSQVRERFAKFQDEPIQPWIFGEYRIAYDHKELKVVIEKMLDILNNVTHDIFDPKVKEEKFLELSSWIGIHLLSLAPQCKHAGYKEENEYRFAMFSPHKRIVNRINENPGADERGFFYRDNGRENNVLVNPIPTIISEQFSKDCISEIWIGPACHKKQAEYKVREILNKHGYGEIPIRYSDIPYRG